MRIEINPIAKPRQTRSDRWNERPIVMRYRAYCDELRYKMKKPVPPRVDITFGIPMPKSWSKKKKLEMNGEPHQQTPDIDNLIKGFLDPLCEDDAYVYEVHARKYWSEEGYIALHW